MSGMVVSIFTRSGLVAAMLVLAACAEPASVNGMFVPRHMGPSFDAASPFRSAIAIKQVSGGEETNPAWTSEIDSVNFREALRRSLLVRGLLAEPARARYDLSANLISVDQPLIGLSLTVTTEVEYRLEQRSPPRVVYDQGITAPFTASASSSFYAVTRLKLANEGAGRENIRLLLEDLSKLRPGLRLSSR